MMCASVVLPRPGGPKIEHVIERFGALTRGADEDLELRLHRRLADVVVERARTNGPVDGLVFAIRVSGDDAFASELF